MRKPLLFVDMDGTLAEWNTSLPKFAKEIFMPGYFKDRPAYPMVAQAIRLLICSGALEVFVISSVIDEPHVIADKNSWLDEHIPEVDNDHRIFCKCGENKAHKVREATGRFDGYCVLLDDYSVNLHQWEKSGGTAIKFLNGINGSKGSWKGAKLSRFASNPTELKDKLLAAIVLELHEKGARNYV